MEDSKIVELFFNRDEAALVQTKTKYENYCYKVAQNILNSSEDSEEILNDVYMAAWNSIPPNHPERLSTYLGKIARRLALKKWRDMTAAKRGGGETLIALDELEEVIPDNHEIDSKIQESELTNAINVFLGALKADERKAFVLRYWYFKSISEISNQLGFTESKVKIMLLRTREKLQKHLEKEGILL